jgi:uncharacterized protein (TIGR02284 family)
MERNEAMNEVLNDLVKVNNDRIAGYDWAIEEMKNEDEELKALFVEMKRQSIKYKDELKREIQKDEGIVEDDTSSSGKIYRAWIDIKSTFGENSKQSVLNSCEFGEDTTQRAYKAALSSDSLLEPNARHLVEEEQKALKKSHELIKQKRDTYGLTR